MKLHRIFQLHSSKLAALVVAVLSLLIVWCALGFVPSRAQAVEERELEDKIPKHLPIKVKIKAEKERAFKDLENGRWFRDLELEVTNTGVKPIYFLALLLELPELTSENGRKLGYPLIYGRSELADFTAKVVAEDVPLEPGKSYTFKIQNKWANGMEGMRARIKKPVPKRVQIRFQVINFGDKTGFMGIDGLPVPQKGAI
ncbi:MAG: hypothetical protein QOF02_3104 [Blastocatellia bacterium]|nr:hypothetical protein [Blastocatellia bacterium]